MRFQVLRRFQIGFVWRFLWHRRVVREALPDAIALSRLACRVCSRSPVGQDSNLVVGRILNDTMRIVSRDPTEALLCHRLAALACIAAIRLHLGPVIRHRLSTRGTWRTRVLSFQVCPSHSAPVWAA